MFQHLGGMRDTDGVWATEDAWRVHEGISSLGREEGQSAGSHADCPASFGVFKGVLMSVFQ